MAEKQIGNPDPITSLGILTCDRTPYLRRSLESYLQNGSRFGRSIQYLVVDDSRSRKMQRDNRRLTHELADKFGSRIGYINRDERRYLAASVAREAAIPDAVSQFAFLGEGGVGLTVGSVNNTLMFLQAGQVSVVADDDTVCRIARVPGFRDELVLTSNVTNEYWFYPGIENATSSLSFEDLDFFRLHEHTLAKRLQDSIDQSHTREVKIDTGSLSPALLQGLTVPESTVGVSLFGAVGDSGMERNHYRLLYQGDSRRRLLSGNYRSNVNTRFILRAPISYSISDNAFCMGMNLGLDLRQLLPPFMPVLRNSDGVFSAVLRVCCQNIFKGYVPYAIVHSPPERRPYDLENDAPASTRLRTNDLIIRLIYDSGATLSGTSAGGRMQSLGQRLVDFASLPLKDVDDLVRTIYHAATSNTINRLEKQLESIEPGSDYWKDVDRLIRAFKNAPSNDGSYVPADLEGSVEEKLMLFKNLICKFGQLLIYWPQIVVTARDRSLIEQGGLQLAGEEAG
jgi:hypothetical protein